MHTFAWMYMSISYVSARVQNEIQRFLKFSLILSSYSLINFLLHLTLSFIGVRVHRGGKHCKARNCETEGHVGGMAAIYAQCAFCNKALDVRFGLCQHEWKYEHWTMFFCVYSIGSCKTPNCETKGHVGFFNFVFLRTMRFLQQSTRCSFWFNLNEKGAFLTHYFVLICASYIFLYILFFSS